MIKTLSPNIEIIAFVIGGTRPEIPQTPEECLGLEQKKCNLRTTTPDRLNGSISFLIHCRKNDEKVYVLHYADNMLIAYESLKDYDDKAILTMHSE